MVSWEMYRDSVFHQQLFPYKETHGGGRWVGLVTEAIWGHAMCGEVLGQELGTGLAPYKPRDTA